MKHYILYLLLSLSLTACCNDDDQPETPIDQLPPATQTGANTAGCLVDGEAIFPKGSGLIFHLFYTDGLNFGLGIGNEKANVDRIINIASLNENLQEGQTYQLSQHEANGKYASYSIGATPPPRENFFETTSTITGELTITHHDFDKAIISGTFWFDAIDSKGNVVQIREGRFDGEY
ncbi:DUF6252 family protein [Formosa sp. A9]|uniref:DUF6252 family protein n=1 Tax=Formosa sp. A9 TaxID=3442641 RepID=UPI003EB8B52B